MTWLLLVQIITGQHIAVPQNSRQACLEAVEGLRSGKFNSLTVLEDGAKGLRLPIDISKGAECVTMDELERRNGKRA